MTLEQFFIWLEGFKSGLDGFPRQFSELFHQLEELKKSSEGFREITKITIENPPGYTIKY
jgi:hypothetical protein